MHQKGNSCILPEGWTVNTLMELHDSKLYNLDVIIAVSYRVKSKCGM